MLCTTSTRAAKKMILAQGLLPLVLPAQVLLALVLRATMLLALVLPALVLLALVDASSTGPTSNVLEAQVLEIHCKW